ncbi:hypothetical protein HYT92_02985 [Candidatus Pacearchaeota archaeon]|nr:hypothetical protein [Candidatus Pacearchaeota archaeon]
MGELLIFKDIADSLMDNPRDVTLFGERNLIPTKESNFDLYYHCAEGIWCPSPGQRVIPYVPFPILKNQGSNDDLIERLVGYYKENGCDYAGLCSRENLILYKAGRAESGVTLTPLNFSKGDCYAPIREEVFKKLGETGRDFSGEISKKTKEIKRLIK